jgi:hypothetical protein
MAVFRETPYSAFNFLVDLEPGQGEEVQAGFSEVSGLNAEITVAEYRAGNDRVNYVRKVPGIHKAGDVTLKRGVIGAQNLYEWLELGRTGKLAQVKRDNRQGRRRHRHRGTGPLGRDHRAGVRRCCSPTSASSSMHVRRRGGWRRSRSC